MTSSGITRQYIPELAQRIAGCCGGIRVLSGTLGDGDVALVQRRASVARSPAKSA
jgi:hypothetical protein